MKIVASRQTHEEAAHEGVSARAQIQGLECLLRLVQVSIVILCKHNTHSSGLGIVDKAGTNLDDALEEIGRAHV